MTQLIDADLWIQKIMEGAEAEDAEEREFRARALRIAAGQAHGDDLGDPEFVATVKRTLPQYRTYELKVLEEDPRDEWEEKVLATLPDSFHFDDEKRQIPFVMSSESQDADGDRILQRGWDLGRFKRSPRLLWAHDHDLPAIGSVPHTRVAEVAKGPALVGLPTFATAEESVLADTVYKLSRPIGPDGKRRRPHINSGSVGFIPIDVKVPKDDDERVEMNVGNRGVLFQRQRLFEFSIVNVGSNADAVQLALKNMVREGEISADVAKRFTGAISGPVTERDWGKRLTKSIHDLGGSKGWADLWERKTRNVGEVLNRAMGMEVPLGDQPVTKSFDVANQHLEAARLEHDWVSRWCSCEIKQLHDLGTGVDRLHAGSFLTGLKHALREYELHDTRNITSDGREVPPSYGVIQLTADRSDDFLVRGLAFYKGPAHVAVKIRKGWGGYEVSVWSKIDDAGAAHKIIADAWEWAHENNFLKGQAFSLSGEFVVATDEKWDGIFLDGDIKSVVQRSIQQMNEQGADCPNRGMIWMGPPGTGKTLSGRVLRNETNATLIWCSTRDFYWTGGSEGIMQAFDLARELSPSVIFLEDIDAWLSRSALDLLKTEMDGLGRSSGVLTILTTNHPKDLPEALIDRPGRFHDVLSFDLPSAQTRSDMIDAWLPDLPTKDHAYAVEESDGMSGAHVFELCAFAKTISVQDGIGIPEAMRKAVDKIKRQREQIAGTKSVYARGGIVSGDVTFVSEDNRGVAMMPIPETRSSPFSFELKTPGNGDLATALEKLAAAQTDMATSNARLARAIEGNTAHGGGIGGPNGPDAGDPPDASRGNKSGDLMRVMSALQDIRADIRKGSPSNGG